VILDYWYIILPKENTPSHFLSDGGGIDVKPCRGDLSGCDPRTFSCQPLMARRGGSLTSIERKNRLLAKAVSRLNASNVVILRAYDFFKLRCVLHRWLTSKSVCMQVQQTPTRLCDCAYVANRFNFTFWLLDIYSPIVLFRFRHVEGVFS
jgi:hypothetical protein